MALTLRVTSFHSHALGAQSTKTFGAQGGSIGRKPGNDWVLPDPERFVSGSHAAIVCRNGNYYLRDTSANGTFVNGSPIGNGMEQPLSEGDRLQLGEYEITVSLDRADVTGPTGFDMGHGLGYPAGASGPRATTGPTGRNAPAAMGGMAQDLGQPTSADPLDFFRNDAPPPQRAYNDPGVFSDHSSALEDFYQPPAIEAPPPAQASPSGIPEDWDKTGFSQGHAPRRAQPMPPPMQQMPPQMPPMQQMPPQMPPQMPQQMPPQMPPQMPQQMPPMQQMPPQMPQQQMPPQSISHTQTAVMPPMSDDQSGALAAVLAAAGLDPGTARMAAAMPGMHAVLGQMLGVVVQGLLDTLKARAEIKSQFRVAVTSMRPVENNPLKFSANAGQALQNLLAGRNQAYLGPVDAFVEGFQDIKAHQIAMMAGMRAAFDSMLERFNPDELAGIFEKRLKHSPIRIPGKGRYWELYRDLYEERTQDADANFQRLFGDKFAQAYEEQMRRLTVARR